MSGEVWSFILNGNYLVSDLGRIIRSERITTSNRPLKRKVLNPSKTSTGYLEVCLSIKGVKKNYRVHRLVAKAFLENKENKPCVNHKNSIRSDNRAVNLEWVTVKENNIHAFEKGNGNTKKGNESNLSKLNSRQVMKIYKDLNYTSKLQKDIAIEYNVTRQLISKIKTKKAWKDLTDSLDKKWRIYDN
jgi:hypothetical protein